MGWNFINVKDFFKMVEDVNIKWVLLISMWFKRVVFFKCSLFREYLVFD